MTASEAPLRESGEAAGSSPGESSSGEVRRHRRIARAALYLSLGVVVLAAPLALRWIDHRIPRGTEVAWAKIDYRSLPEVQLLQEYLRIDTTAVVGDEVTAARFLAARLAEVGIDSEIIRLGERRANLVAILEGKRPEALVLHHHMDVEPVPDPSLWRHPPFGGEIEGPWIFGRGVFDMKSLAIAQLVAIRELARNPEPPERSVIFLATSSEEVGSDLGTRWLLQNRPELAQRFWAVLTEGGVVEARSGEDIKYWGVEFLQKRFLDLLVCSQDREQLETLRRELVLAPKARENIRLVPEIAEFLRVYAPTRDRRGLREAFADPEALVRTVDEYSTLPAYARSMLRSEAVPFPVGEAEGGGYEMLIKLQLLPGDDAATARARLVPPWWTWGLSATLRDEHGASGGSPLGHPAYRGIVEVLHRRMPGVPVGPFFLPWTATDSRFFRARGIPSYGFSPFLIFSTDTLSIAQPNERMGLWGYVSGVDLYRETVESIVGGRVAPRSDKSREGSDTN